jgi:hypothetical protein
MTCGRVHHAAGRHNRDGATASHSAELVRGDFEQRKKEGPLIRPFGPPSPQGEKGRTRLAHRDHDAFSHGDLRDWRSDAVAAGSMVPSGERATA